MWADRTACGGDGGMAIVVMRAPLIEGAPIRLTPAFVAGFA